jgi:hypothetical protein
MLAMQTSREAGPVAATAPRRHSRARPFILLALLTAGLALLLRQGLVPWSLNPLPAIDLAQPDGWFIDWRLAALKYRPELCQRILKAPYFVAQPIADNPPKGGCGWVNAVRMTTAGGIHAGYDKITCEAAAALALWLQYDVQSLAREILGQRVVSIQSFGSYACRDIAGNPFWKGRRSEHASANALDVAAFGLADGRRISVAQYWKGDGAEARFLRAVHKRACHYFHVAIGPDFNAAHHDHFHLDRGIFWRCK